MAGESLAELLEAVKREYGGVPRPAEALAKPTAPTPSITLTPEQKEKIKEALEKIWEVEKKGIKKAGEAISKLFEKYRKEKELAEATGTPVDIEKVLREAGIEVYKPELGVYVK
jgi:uncharacterized protein YoaH (UPF0181 family)